MKNRTLKIFIIVAVVAVIVFLILGFLRKGPGPQKNMKTEFNNIIIK